ncbi:hypothetical protein [Streptomyces luteoverticillatus]|nr:hypothetical protein [Streptomyces luteoverticillatus]
MTLAVPENIAETVLDGLADPARDLHELLAPAWKAVAATTD